MTVKIHFPALINADIMGSHEHKGNSTQNEVFV